MSLKEAVKMFRESLLNAFRDWLTINRNAIGEKWYASLRKDLAEVDADTPINIMAAAMWIFNMIAHFGVGTGIGPPPHKIELQYFNEELDRKSTMRLLYMIQSCMALQYLPREVGTMQIPVITKKKFSLQAFIEQQ